MELLNLSDLYYLRMLNIVFVYYGANRTLQSNYREGKVFFASNAVSAFLTALAGIFLSTAGLLAYIYAKGGDAYIQNLSETFLFVGTPTAVTYTITLLIEGIVSALIVTFTLMLFWKKKYPSD
jgi:predicted membrane protein